MTAAAIAAAAAAAAYHLNVSSICFCYTKPWGICTYLCCVDIALVVVKALNQTSVVPTSNDIVGPIMDFHFNGVPSVVDEEDDGIELVSDHAGHILHVPTQACVHHIGM